ncbi:FAD/NAD(P)-binding protein [Aporhodopirellula aestuarii]|uniref:FAD/NAD(P)-binding protein n=1 Tax=Aporhodopirellula aestuarii TaxID=2950107 RepID=A0ABT0TYM5_9BACT|nr:FAD/NAD(P)-binding protein [Aporhodopirellula aestuarii]MCM2369704.1 FAD/NAD(P)-binding protein [Aporhodopirellula aestuarii]
MLSPRTEPWAVAAARVRDVKDEAPGVQTYWIELSEAGDRETYAAKPGQFNMLYMPGVGEAAISLSHLPSPGGQLVHTVRSVGNVTRALAVTKAGDSLGVRGPFGSYWPLERGIGKDLILVAGGIGLAPLRPLVDEILSHRQQFGRVSLLIGARTPSDLLYTDDYESWRTADIEVQTTVDRAAADWKGNVGVVTLLLNRLGITSPLQTMIFTCGPEVMMTYAIRAVRERGVPRENLWVSLERNMNCAIGQCGHCQLGPHFICKEGPVLRYDQVKNWMHVDSL